MAPEQAEGKTVDARSDIFSFGSVLYEMLTGQRAFQGDSPLSTLTAVLRDEPEPLSKTTHRLPRELERVISRCLRKDPDRRWQSMADVKVALRELKEELDSGEVKRQCRRRRPQRRTWAAAAALVVVVISAIGAFLWRDRSAGVRRGGAVHRDSADDLSGPRQQPSFSPDGNSVAFAWNGEAEDNWDIYVS